MKKSFKVSAATKVEKLAGAIAACIREEDEIELQAIGAGALNQAVKAIAIARGLLVPAGTDIAIAPHFEEREIAERITTVIVLEVRKND